MCARVFYCPEQHRNLEIGVYLVAFESEMEYV